MRATAAHLALQPGLRQPPVAHHRCGRHFQDGSGFLNAQPAKESHLDDAALPLVEFRQHLQCIVERLEVLRRLIAYDERFVESHSHSVATPLLIVLRTGVVYQDVAHHTSAHREEMCMVFPRYDLPVDQADVGLVDESRRLEAMSDVFSSHAAARDPMELLIDERDQSLEGGFVALSPFDQQSGNFRFGFRSPDILCSSPLRTTSRVAIVATRAWSKSASTDRVDGVGIEHQEGRVSRSVSSL